MVTYLPERGDYHSSPIITQPSSPPHRGGRNQTEVIYGLTIHREGAKSAKETQRKQ